MGRPSCSFDILWMDVLFYLLDFYLVDGLYELLHGPEAAALGFGQLPDRLHQHLRQVTLGGQPAL